MPTLANLIELPSEVRQSRGLQYTPQEIAQQPDTWKTTLALFTQERARIANFLDRAGVRDALEQRPVIVLVGAGTSDYIGHALVLLLRQAWGCEVIAAASTDLLPNLEAWLVPERRYLWISFSRSGNSPEGVAVLQHAIELYPGVAHLVVTCNAEARMIQVIQEAPVACSIVLDDAVNDRSLAMTSSFTNMVLMGQCLAHTWSLADYLPIHKQLVQAGHGMLANAAAVADQVASSHPHRACFIGSGALASVARESALKLLEMTAGQVETMSETVLGLRHGPMAALNSSTLLVCYASGDRTRAMYSRDLLQEIGTKQIASQRIVVGPAELEPEFAEVAEHYVTIDDSSLPGESIPDTYRPVLDVIFGQMLGLFCSVARGLQPDAPSPGNVINRVVEQFRIY